MFNGLIREIAKVQSYQNNTLSLKAKYRPNLGDSIAVNGACLSVTKLYEGGFEVELSRESRTHIAIENLKDKVHIESALRYGDRIDGHLMQGHIDFIGTLEKIQKDENGVDFH
ncbi:riboflavin synthase, partial [Campylobacter sp. BCW_8712]